MQKEEVKVEAVIFSPSWLGFQILIRGHPGPKSTQRTHSYSLKFVAITSPG